MNEQFRTDWSRFHHNLEPTGWLLRSGSIPWVRFHALPDSKRYAEDATERATILARAYALAAEVLGEGAPCWMIVSRTGEEVAGTAPALEWTYDDDGDLSIWRSYVSLIEWRTGEHDQVLTDIAEWKTANEVWMARATGEIFAPYDGGFDLFLSDWTRVAFLKQKWADWLSSHPEGL
ncbi:hypothetical protein [Methylobacterium sp. E-045]|uniref:DUF3885 domain-containing protein n=1 Tax=Methylobacterium sp. E-045 TaxID=2836575 RepID=UPI001FBA0139|nr:hypothetical protein [Methylobacterium sp. E-045]MCJ2131477.1 hypothetical protein [Methylobacterium sp. E-045]